MLVIISSFQEKTPSRQPGNRYSVLEIKTNHHSPDFVPEHSLFFLSFFLGCVFAKSYGFRMALVELLKDDSL